MTYYLGELMNEVKAISISIEAMTDLIESSTLLKSENFLKDNMKILNLKKQGCIGNLIVIQSEIGNAVLMGLRSDIESTMPETVLIN